MAVGFIVIAAATVAGLSGFGFAMVATPALHLVHEPAHVVSLALVLSLPLNIGAALYPQARADVDRRALILLMTGGLVGAPVGALLLAELPTSSLRLGAGVVATLFALAPTDAVRKFAGRRMAAPKETLAVGCLAGLLSTSTALNGPPIILYFMARDLSPTAFRRSVAMSLLGLTLVSIVALYISGTAPAGLAAELLPLLPPVAVGFALGAYAFRRTSPRLFYLAARVIVAMLGLLLIWQSH